MQVPTVIMVTLAPVTEQMVGVVEVNTTVPPGAVAETATGDALNVWAAGPVNVMVWLALFTVITRVCVAAGAVPVAVTSRLNVPAALGVPVSVAVPVFAPPEVNVRPAGAAPAVMVGRGTPVAAILNVAIAAPKVSGPTAVPDVNAGGTGVGAGVTLAVAEAAPGPAMLVAVTEQVYGVPLTSPFTVIGDVAPAPVIAPGLHVAV